MMGGRTDVLQPIGNSRNTLGESFHPSNKSQFFQVLSCFPVSGIIKANESTHLTVKIVSQTSIKLCVETTPQKQIESVNFVGVVVTTLPNIVDPISFPVSALIRDYLFNSSLLKSRNFGNVFVVSFNETFSELTILLWVCSSLSV
jgi:hypothetical protein